MIPGLGAVERRVDSFVDDLLTSGEEAVGLKNPDGSSVRMWGLWVGQLRTPTTHPATLAHLIIATYGKAAKGVIVSREGELITLSGIRDDAGVTTLTTDGGAEVYKLWPGTAKDDPKTLVLRGYGPWRDTPQALAGAVWRGKIPAPAVANLPAVWEGILGGSHGGPMPEALPEPTTPADPDAPTPDEPVTLATRAASVVRSPVVKIGAGAIITAIIAYALS